MYTQVYTSFVSDLQTDWLSLEHNCSCSVFQSFKWCQHWFSRIGSKNSSIQLSIIVVYVDHSPVALFPFCVRKIGFLRLLEFIGGDLSDYNSPIVHPDFIDDQTFHSLFSIAFSALPPHDLRSLVRIPETIGPNKNPFVTILRPIYNLSSYSATLPSDWSTYLSTISPKIIKENARNKRKLSSLGNLQFILASTDDEANHILDSLFEQKQRRYISTGARNILADSSVRDFYRSFFQTNSSNFNVHISAIALDDSILAAHFGFIYDNCFYYLMPAFDSIHWSRYSPGRLLLEYLLFNSVSDSLHTFDFTTGAEQYKSTWCNTSCRLYSHLESQSIFGFFLKLYFQFVMFSKSNQLVRGLAMKINHHICSLTSIS